MFSVADVIVKRYEEAIEEEHNAIYEPDSHEFRSFVGDIEDTYLTIDSVRQILIYLPLSNLLRVINTAPVSLRGRLGPCYNTH